MVDELSGNNPYEGRLDPILQIPRSAAVYEKEHCVWLKSLSGAAEVELGAALGNFTQGVDAIRRLDTVTKMEKLIILKELAGFIEGAANSVMDW